MTKKDCIAIAAIISVSLLDKLVLYLVDDFIPLGKKIKPALGDQ